MIGIKNLYLHQVMKRLFILALSALSLFASAQNKTTGMNEQCISMTQEWDKTFPLSEKVNHEKVTFKNQYGFTLAADLYTPKGNDTLRYDDDNHNLHYSQRVLFYFLNVNYRE